jgi:hypothetical protein
MYMAATLEGAAVDWPRSPALNPETTRSYSLPGAAWGQTKRDNIVSAV